MPTPPVRIKDDPEVATFLVSDGEEAVHQDHENVPLLQQSLCCSTAGRYPARADPITNRSHGMLSARWQGSPRDISLPFHENSSNTAIDKIKIFCERGSVLRKLGLTALACFALCFEAVAISRKMDSSGQRAHGKYVARSDPGFVNYVGVKVDASIPDRAPLCDPDIVRATCEVLNNATLEYYGDSAEATLDYVHATEVSAVLAVNKDSVHELFQKLKLTDYDHTNSDAYAVSCQQLCENLVASFPPMVVPRMSDVGCYWHPLDIKSGIEFTPKCNVDLAPQSLAKILFSDVASTKEDNLFGENKSIQAMNWPGMSREARRSALANPPHDLAYHKDDYNDLRRRVINTFRIYPSLNSKVSDNVGIARLVAPQEPGPFNLATIWSNNTATLKKSALATKSLATSIVKNISTLSKTVGRGAKTLSKNASTLEKNIEHDAASLSRNISRISRSIGNAIATAATRLGQNISTIFRVAEANISALFAPLGPRMLQKRRELAKVDALGAKTQSPDDSCKFALDGHCDYDTGSCSKGTDCTDCMDCLSATRPDDTCRYSRDGECDEPSVCEKGTDCTDCGGCVREGQQVQLKRHRETFGGTIDWKLMTLRNTGLARGLLNQAITGMASRQIPHVVTRWYGNSQENPTRHEVMRLLNDVKDVLDNAEFVYPGDYCTPGMYAYIFPNSPYKKDTLGKFIFHLCDYFVKAGATEQIETLLHEGARHAGASTSEERWEAATMNGRFVCRQVAQLCAGGNVGACSMALKSVDNFCYFVNDVSSNAIFSR